MRVFDSLRSLASRLFQRSRIDRDATREIGHQEAGGCDKRIGAAGNLD